MSNTTTIYSHLKRIAELLASHGEPTWAASFEHFASEFDESPELAKGRIRSVFGGMGSFNDIVLHGPNGVPLGPENEELDRLRSELYSKCQSQIGAGKR